MKIPSSKQINKVISHVKSELPEVIQETLETKTVQQSALECSSNMQKAFVKSTSDNTSVLKKFLQDKNMHIHRESIIHDGIMRLRAGKEFPGFKGLYDTDLFIAQVFDESENLSKIYIQDARTKAITVLNSSGELEKFFDEDIMKGLYFYKYHPDSIHQYLRNNVQIWGGNFWEETKESIQTIEKIFNERTLTQKTDMPKVVYRGMHTSKENIGNVGDIFEDKSFVSTTTKLNVAERFAGENPVMKIELPENIDYINLDMLFNIDRVHWNEKEFLLNKNSKFKILGYNEANNTISARLVK